MTPIKQLLLAGTAMLMLTASPAAQAAESGKPIVLAQAAPAHQGDKEKEKAHEKGAQKPAHEPPPQHQPAKPAQAQPQHQEPKPAQAQQKPAEKPAGAPQHQAQPKPAETKPAEKPAAAQKPEPKREDKAEPRHQDNRKPAAAEQKPEQKPTAQQKNEAKPAAQEQKQQQAPAAQTKPAAPNQPPAAQSKPAAPAQQPAAQAPAAEKPAAQSSPAAQPPANNAQTNAPAQPNAQTAAPAPAVVAPPTKPQSTQNFILQKNAKPTVTIQDVRKDRHERREGNRTIITEGDRTIVKQDNRVIIRHSETQRFAVGARDVNVERHGNETTTVVVRPDGVRIINVTDERGHLIRRVRRDRGGKEIVIIDERERPRREEVFIDLPPPVIRIPRERYIVELDRARPQMVYEVLDAPPVERVTQTYTVDQVRYSAPLRERMPRIDLDINFETGSWQLTPDQIDKLNVVADGLKRAIGKNPREVFLIEGHTDAVGNDEDNLSLSDRRAESVAVALTEQFHVPPENLVTQGYGEQNLKVQTEGASRENRRVSVRRITPLIDKQAAR
jgi:outer membrane protein OmpA-like peptidoglycan-associated protein